MLRTMRAALYRALGLCEWHKATRGPEFIWRRFDADTDQWVEMAMTEREQEDALSHWSIR